MKSKYILPAILVLCLYSAIMSTLAFIQAKGAHEEASSASSYSFEVNQALQNGNYMKAINPIN